MDTQTNRMRTLNWTGIGFAILQSICSFAMLASSVGALMGFSLLAAMPSVTQYLFAFHADKYRIPMELFALVVALVNLWVLARVRRLRANPASDWRKQPIDAKQVRSERIQFWISIATLVILAIESACHLNLTGHI